MKVEEVKNEACVQEFLQNLKAEDVKTKLSGKTSDLFSVGPLCCEISLLWHFFALRSACFETSLL